MTANPLPTEYRACVGICLFNRDGKVFVGQRLDRYSTAWQMPQGGVDPGEDPAVAAAREMLEEIGTDKGTIVAQTRDWLSYDLPTELIGKLWKGRYRGQKQLWFLFRFDGEDSDINIETDEPEFGAWQWIPIEQTVESIVEFKRDLYAQVVAEFAPIIAAETSKRS